MDPESTERLAKQLRARHEAESAERSQAAKRPSVRVTLSRDDANWLANHLAMYVMKQREEVFAFLRKPDAEAAQALLTEVDQADRLYGMICNHLEK